MQGTLRCIGSFAATVKNSSESVSSTASLGSLTRVRCRPSAALVFPSAASDPTQAYSLSSRGVPRPGAQNQREAAKYKDSSLGPLKESSWSKDGRLGQAGAKDGSAFALRQKKFDESTRQFLQSLPFPSGPEEVIFWQRLAISFRYRYGEEGAWEVFLELTKRGRSEILTNPSADTLRDRILAAALNDNERLTTLLDCAQHMRKLTAYEWPELYMKILYFYLDQSDYENAFLWHLRLAPTFPPGADIFGAIMSSFVVDPEPKLQSTLTTMYVFSTYRSLYDHIVPALFEAGRSKLARSWRKKLLSFQDRPLTIRSRPFVQFLSRYYPQVPLEKEEYHILGIEDAASVTIEMDPASDYHGEPQPSDGEHRGYLSDSFVAKWFASSWNSPEFAINLMHKLGLRVVGPRSLQSLALREEDTYGVLARISQLERLDIRVSSRTYCKALVYFVRQNDEQLLSDLLRCDIHPDEFEDVETRQLLMAASVRRMDWKLERLLQGIEWALEEKSSSRDLNKILRDNLHLKGLGKSRIILDRMSSLNVEMAPKNAATLLKRVYEPLAFHPKKSWQHVFGFKKDPRLDRAIDVTRRIATKDVAIPLKYWRILLYNLGRSGRFDELEELSLHIVQLYNPSTGGLIPVHIFDLPNTLDTRAPGPVGNQDLLTGQKFLSKFFSSNEVEDGFNSFEAEGIDTCQEGPSSLQRSAHVNRYNRSSLQHSWDGKTNVFREHIPSDLPSSHRQHPLHKIFDTKFQRAVVRWGFDQNLADEPAKSAILEVRQNFAGAFDVACGVRLLATLRQQGVLIDKQVVRAAVISRLALAQVPGRRRARARDSHQLSPRNIKGLVDEAWGEELLPQLTDLIHKLEDEKPKLWSRYPTLFGKAYDPDYKPPGEARDEDEAVSRW